MTLTTAAPGTVPSRGPRDLTEPVPGLVTIEGLSRMMTRLRELAEGWTAEADRHYADEVPALLPHLSPRLARSRFGTYAVALQRVCEYDDMSEGERRDEWGTEHLCERANMVADRDFALAGLIHGHPYHPAWRAETFADPFLMADLIAELRRELLEERTEHARTKIKYHDALTDNDSMHDLVQALTDAPVPYVTAHLALVPDAPGDDVQRETAPDGAS